MIVRILKSYTLIGKIDRFNHDIPSSSYKIFWVDGDEWKSGWCKGNITSEIKVGDRVNLIGRWHIDEKYPSFGSQFFFSSCTKLPPNDVDSGKTSPQEEVTGYIYRMKDRNGNARLFIFKTTNGESLDCYGRVIPGHEIYSEDRLILYGHSKTDTIQPEQERKFHYNKYIKIKGAPVKFPSPAGQQITGNHKSFSVSTAPLNKIQLFLKDIGQITVEYKFHSPVKNTISRHVRTQLLNRIEHSTKKYKDFYFLTAILDRNALDVDVQNFRADFPDFKEILFKCWDEACHDLEKAIKDIKYTIENKNKICSSPTYEQLYPKLPGPYKKNQILVCLKIIDEIYKRDREKTILDMCRSFGQERALRKYLLGLYGVKYKIANWSLTNVTGHWFVIDRHIKKTIKKCLNDTVNNLTISSDYCDQIFDNWFGVFDEETKSYSKISQDLFKEIFPDFISRADYQCLPFIVTQHLWFYGKSVL